MWGIRLPIWIAMGVVLVIAAGSAGMRSASAWVAVVAQLASVAALAASVLLAASRRGRTRWAWGGFAAFGLSYLIAFPFPKHRERIQPFLMFDVLEWLNMYFPSPLEYAYVTTHSFMIVLFGALGAVAGPLLAGGESKDAAGR